MGEGWKLKINRGEPLEDSEVIVEYAIVDGDIGDEDLSRFEEGSSVVGIPLDDQHQASVLIGKILHSSSVNKSFSTRISQNSLRQ